jgi:hypothetical protein
MLKSRSLLVSLALLVGCSTAPGSKDGVDDGADVDDPSDSGTGDGDTGDGDSGEPAIPANRCPPPDGAIKTQEDLEVYATCTAIEGSVQVEGPDIHSLTALRHVEEIEGSLLIGQHTSLSSLDGLESLRTLDGSLVLQNNAALTDTSALSRLVLARSLTAFGSPLLTHIETTAAVERVELHSLPALVEAPGIIVQDELQFVSLPRLASWGGLRITSTVSAVRLRETGLATLAPLTPLEESDYLIFIDNDALVSITGLDNLREVELLELEGSPLLTELGPLAALETADTLTLGGLSSLVDSSALAGLSTLASLELRGEQPDLDLSGLSGLRTLSGALVIEASGELDLRPLAGLRTVGELNVLDNAGLTTLAGLSGLAELDGLRVSGNAQLESLAGLEALDTRPSTLQSLDLLDNTALHELALGGVVAVEDWVFAVLNPELDSCALEARAAEWNPETVTIGNNGPCL